MRGANQRGVSLIAAVFVLTVLAFMGVIFVSLISTGGLMAVNDLQSVKALLVAEAGLEYEQRALAQNVDWYRSADPLDTVTRSLGSGSFTATTSIPATKLSRRLRAGDATAYVYTTSRFPSSGALQVEDDVAGSAEFVLYTGVTASSFTGLTRGRTIGSVATAAANHARGSTVYPVAALGIALPNSCTAVASITIAANTKFLGAGIVEIEGEEISYSASSISGGNLVLTGIQRCAGPTPSAAHAAGQPVTPLLVGGVTADLQSEITSTGIIAGAVRVLRKTVER